MNQNKRVQVSLDEATTYLSLLITLVEDGAAVVISRDGNPVAELIPTHKTRGLPIGVAAAEPLFERGNE